MGGGFNPAGTGSLLTTRRNMAMMGRHQQSLGALHGTKVLGPNQHAVLPSLYQSNESGYNTQTPGECYSHAGAIK